MFDVLRDLAREPRPPLVDEPLMETRATWLLIAFAVVAGLLEIDPSHRLPSIAIGIAMAVALRWFRTHAFVLAVAFSIVGLLYERWQLTGAATFALAVTTYGLVAVYAVARYGSGPEIVIASIVVVARPILLLSALPVRGTELAAFVLSAIFPIGFGLAGRIQAGVRQEKLEAVRLGERHELARELHDTVAHHVSAITIQAQAARAIFATKPETALAVLETIEEEAARSLDEMRRMVTVLRDHETNAELRPQAGIEGIRELASADHAGPRVEVQTTGRLDHLGSSIEASLFRLAQEAVTNARRHARQATRITVEIDGSDDQVELRVTDNGAALGRVPAPGFGLTGLRERAEQLGGSFRAGPGDDQGWIVHAALPIIDGGVAP